MATPKKIKTYPTNKGYITGRNGTYGIKGVSIMPYGIGNYKMVSIEGIGKRGKIINGGLSMAVETFEEICKDFLGGNKK